jgi:hypothetical protein
MATEHLRSSLLVISALALLTLAGAAQAATPDQQQLVSDFEARVSSYMKLRDTTAPTANEKPTKSPDKLMQQRSDISSRVLSARSNAKQGDIFTPDIAIYFRHQIAATLDGPQGARIRASLRHAEPVKGRLQVNQKYPAHVPLQSTPPTLLLNLPTLPKDLEYRIVGQDLVLRDTGANLIVDFIPNVLPQS